jgi:2,4-dienoyl-CoA reductase (NADPH2)
VGKSVAIIGAGGIGFDVAEFLVSDGPSLSLDPQAFAKHWGIDFSVEARGGIAGVHREKEPSPREVFLLQRSATKLGANLGKTTGWIHRTQMKDKKVKLLNSVNYLKIDDQGLHIEINHKKQLLAVDHVVICAGQEPLRELYDALLKAQAKQTTTTTTNTTTNRKTHLIGGAEVAAELDAKRAIHQGTTLAAGL